MLAKQVGVETLPTRVTTSNETAGDPAREPYSTHLRNQFINTVPTPTLPCYVPGERDRLKPLKTLYPYILSTHTYRYKDSLRATEAFLC